MAGADDSGPPGDAHAWLQFALTPKLGPAAQRKLLRAFGGPREVLEAAGADLVRTAGESAAAALRSGADTTLVDETLHWLDEAGNHLLTLADHRYPRALLETADPPVLLFVKGRIDLLDRPALAVVGSRNGTGRGVRDAEAFAHLLSDAGLTIVSGLALGIDSAAHRGGLGGRSSSVAVVGTGLDKVYPARNRELAHRLAADGALISEFPLGTPPLAANFPRRNRVISGLARGCLVVEAALRSGSLITARQASEQGREVFAIPGSIHSPLSKGCHWLIKQGAKLVETAQDILEELGMGRVSAPPEEDAAPLPASDSAVLASMGFEPVDPDTICDRTGLGPDAAASILLRLELEGYLARLPGGLLQRMR
ncbi:MAG TPA: DNA-processing protein DprA [Burkholderiales bacterium]|nr:DNA-processing protein DprA [Burkholderiales bacterium]